MSTINNSFIIKPAAEELLVSIIIPVFNEEETLQACYEQIVRAIAYSCVKFEFIFIDDGSTDKSVEILQCIQSNDERVKQIMLSRNFGKEAAMSAGLKFSSGDAVIIIDADLQDPPEQINTMIDKWLEGAEVVCMRRRSRAGETAFKKATSHLYYRILSLLSDIPIPMDVGDFRLMSRKVVDATNRLQEANRYMKGLFAWVGFSPVYIDYDRAPRVAGKTKWNNLGLFRLAIQGITSFSVVPLRFMIFSGLIVAGGGIAFGVWIMLKTLVFGEAVAGYPSLVSLITFLGGMQLFATGVLGEYIGKVYIEAKKRPLYVVDKVSGIDDPTEVYNDKYEYTADAG